MYGRGGPGFSQGFLIYYSTEALINNNQNCLLFISCR